MYIRTKKEIEILKKAFKEARILNKTDYINGDLLRYYEDAGENAKFIIRIDSNSDSFSIHNMEDEEIISYY